MPESSKWVPKPRGPGAISKWLNVDYPRLTACLEHYSIITKQRLLAHINVKHTEYTTLGLSYAHVILTHTRMYSNKENWYIKLIRSGQSKWPLHVLNDVPNMPMSWQ